MHKNWFNLKLYTHGEIAFLRNDSGYKWSFIESFITLLLSSWGKTQIHFVPRERNTGNFVPSDWQRWNVFLSKVIFWKNVMKIQNSKFTWKMTRPAAAFWPLAESTRCSNWILEKKGFPPLRYSIYSRQWLMCPIGGHLGKKNQSSFLADSSTTATVHFARIPRLYNLFNEICKNLLANSKLKSCN